MIKLEQISYDGKWTQQVTHVQLNSCFTHIHPQTKYYDYKIILKDIIV